MQGRNYLCEEHTGVIGECLHQRLQELGGEQSRERVPVCCMELGAGGQAQTVGLGSQQAQYPEYIHFPGG